MEKSRDEQSKQSCCGPDCRCGCKSGCRGGHKTVLAIVLILLGWIVGYLMGSGGGMCRKNKSMCDHGGGMSCPMMSGAHEAEKK